MAYAYTFYPYSGSYLTRTDRYDNEGNDWTTRTAAPATARAQIFGSAAAYGDEPTHHLAGGGFSSGGAVHHNDCERYTVSGDSWSGVANMPTAKGDGGQTFLEGFVYFTGGIAGASYYTENARFGILASVWSVEAVLPNARGRHDASAAYDLGYQYLYLGATTGGANQNWCTRYHHSGDIWSAKAASDVTGSYVGAWEGANDLYGYYKQGYASVVMRRYEFAADDHTARTNLINNHNDGSACQLGGAGFQIGDDSFTAKLDRFNESANTWSNRADFTIASAQAGAGATGAPTPPVLKITDAHMLTTTQASGDPGLVGEVKITYNLTEPS